MVTTRVLRASRGRSSSSAAARRARGASFKHEQVIAWSAILCLAATALRVRLCTLGMFLTACTGIEFAYLVGILWASETFPGRV